MITNNYLAKFKKKYTSQCGEDGIIEVLFEKLNISSGAVVDIGAADGKWNSNTYTLLNRGFEVYAVEASNKAKKLIELRESYPNLYPIQAKISIDTSSEFHINAVLDKLNVPTEIELINIDVDSIDAWIFNDLNRRPKIVIIEIEPRYYPLDDIWHNLNGNRETNPPQNLTGFGPIYKIAKSKEYHLVATSSQNLFFLRNDLLSRLNMPEVTEVPELSNFDPKYLSPEDKLRWKNYEPPQDNT